MSFRVVIPGPAPSVNTAYKVITINGRGRLAKHGAVSTWQDEVMWRVRQARPANWEPARRIRLTIEWWTKRRRDSDNGIKYLGDAVAKALGIDDDGFLYTIALNEIDRATPRTVVVITNEDDGDE